MDFVTTIAETKHCLNGIVHLVTDIDPIRFELHNIANSDTLTAYRMEGALVTIVRHEQTTDFPVLLRVELQDVISKLILCSKKERYNG
jgi:hypothetical protein